MQLDVPIIEVRLRSQAFFLKGLNENRFQFYVVVYAFLKVVPFFSTQRPFKGEKKLTSGFT
jgi:hypothetical protein